MRLFSVNKIIALNNLWCYLRSHGGQQGRVSDENADYICKYEICIMYHVSTLNSEGPWNKRFMLALQIINQAKSVCIIILLLRARCSYETKQTNGPQPFYNRVQTQIYAFNTCFIMLRSEFDLVLISWPRSQHFDIWHRGQWPVTTLSADISPGGAGARRTARLDALGPEVAREPREAAVTTPGVRAQVTEIKWMIVNKIFTISFLILSAVCVTWTDFLVHHPVFLDLRGAFLFRQINSIPKMFAEMIYGRCGAFYLLKKLLNDN